MIIVIRDGAPTDPPEPRCISFTQIIPGDNCRCDINVSFRDGIALVIQPGEGVIVEGELLDCPEHDPDTGWVVLEAGGRLIAAASPSFRQLMIENSPCHLRLESVCRLDASGRPRCDWIAFELSPAGGKILVSDEPLADENVSKPREDSMPGGTPNRLEEHSRPSSGQTKNLREPIAKCARSKNCRLGGGEVNRGVVAMFICLVAGCGPSPQTAIEPLDLKSAHVEQRDDLACEMINAYDSRWSIESGPPSAVAVSNLTVALRRVEELMNLSPDERKEFLERMDCNRRPPCSLQW